MSKAINQSIRNFEWFLALCSFTSSLYTPRLSQAITRMWLSMINSKVVGNYASKLWTLLWWLDLTILGLELKPLLCYTYTEVGFSNILYSIDCMNVCCTVWLLAVPASFVIKVFSSKPASYSTYVVQYCTYDIVVRYSTVLYYTVRARYFTVKTWKTMTMDN